MRLYGRVAEERRKPKESLPVAYFVSDYDTRQ